MIRRFPLLLLMPLAAAAAEPELRIPEAAWTTRFEGLHAEYGACEDPEAVWALATGTVEMGRAICTGLGQMTWEEGLLLVPLSQFSRMGELVAGGWLRDAGEGPILARIADREIAIGACPPPG